MPQAVIIAGGQGTRLAGVLGIGVPKALAEVGGKSLLEHQIELVRRCGFDDILVLTGFGADHITSQFGGQVRCVREPEALGTAGAVLHAFEHLAERFVLLYGDTMVNVDLARLWAAHPRETAATLFLHSNDHPCDSDLVEIDEAGRVTALHPYPHPPGQYFRNLVNAALYVFEKKALEPFREKRKLLDFGKHVLPEMVGRGARLQGYVTREYIKDAGTPERLERVRADYASGRIARSSLNYALPAIFFDRDGTLNEEVSFISDPAMLQLVPGAGEAVRLVNERGWLGVVVTNQAVIARGECTEAGLRVIHNKLEWLLGEEHAYLDGIYYCPHHPQSGFTGERADLKITCNCRKPGTGLIQRAVSDLGIDLKRSWFIGDRESDLLTAVNARMKSVLVETGYGRQVRPEIKPTLRAENVLNAVNQVFTGE